MKPVMFCLCHLCSENHTLKTKIYKTCEEFVLSCYIDVQAGFAWLDWLRMPDGPVPYFLYLLLLSTSRILASSQLTMQPSSQACWAIFIFSRRPLWDFSYVHRATWLEICLFRKYSFCHIRKEGCRHTVQSIVDLFPTPKSVFSSEDHPTFAPLETHFTYG
jgi:hypothetical protein